MAKTVLMANSGAVQTQTGDSYTWVTGAINVAMVTEANAQTTFNQAGIISGLCVNVSANTTTACSFYVRQNAGNSSVTVSYTSGQTGIKTDLTNTLTVSAGDEINYFVDVTSGTSIGLENISCVFDSTSDTYKLFQSTVNSIAQNDNLTRYYYFLYAGAANATEANTQCEMLTPGNFKHLFVNVTANTHTTAASNFYLSINASTTGCPTVQYLATQTGFKEDTSTTKTSVDGDLATFKIITASNAGTTAITFSTLSIGYYNYTGKYQQTAINTGTVYTFGITRYFSPHTYFQSDTTESNREVTHLAGNVIMSELVAEVSANTNNGTTTIDFRVNRADASPVIQLSYGASVTGTKSVKGGARVINGDEIDYKLITGGSSGNFTLQQLSSLYEQQPQFYQTNKFNFVDIDEGEEIG